MMPQALRTPGIGHPHFLLTLPSLVSVVRRAPGWSEVVPSLPPWSPINMRQLQQVRYDILRHVLSSDAQCTVSIQAWTNIPLENCVSQASDGASLMSGKANGVQKLLREKVTNPGVFVHCYVHRLNLVLSVSLTDYSVHVNFLIWKGRADVLAFQCQDLNRSYQHIYTQIFNEQKSARRAF